ncbi:hypothetical protein AOCH_000444 [Aspergillus ochraceoroseus]|uniref:Choline transport protein n=1 Tax=Aspergillus ochraceoroseus TaxID=138278 RepID=A0A0F8V2P2_9EURO|nr:hypothetical protein AOCH_000444 [Aspergillus ochraceoroseus]
MPTELLDKSSLVQDDIKSPYPEILEELDSSKNQESSQPATLKRRFNLLTLLSMVIAASAGWESIITSLYQVCIGGGPTVLVWGYIISAIAAIFVSCSLAEFASIWPTSAGQSHWTVALSPPKYRKILTQSMVAITHPDYVAERWHVYVMFLFISIFTLTVNGMAPRIIHYVSIFGMIFHILGFFAIIITLLITTKNKNSARDVFWSIQDNTGWNSDTMAFFIGMLPGAFGFLAIDMPARYSEETKKPGLDVPRSMCWGIVGTALIGLVFVLALAFCMGDPAELLQSPIVSLNPLALIVINSTGSTAAAIGLSASIVIVAFTSSIDSVGSVSRVIMALARDNILPFGEFFAQIHPKWNAPFNAVCLAVALEISIAVIYVGNATAYYCIASGVVTLQVSSYMLPIALQLIFRKRNNIKYGEWSLGSKRYFFNIMGILIDLLIFIVMLFPTTKPITASNMNYGSAIVGGTLILATILYFIWGKKHYIGPLIHLEGMSPN